jgi:acyl carrier protein
LFFSSISAIIGNQEQSSYASANSFLDNYAHFLSQKGFPAYSLNLGAVDDVGVIATDFQLRKIMQVRGVSNGQITVNEVLKIINNILRSKCVQHVPSFDILPLIKSSTLMAQKSSHLVKRIFIDAKSEDKQDLNVDALKVLIGNLLQIEVGAINENEKLTTYGVDSLLAVEISSLLESKFEIKVSQMDILGGATINSFLK